MACGVEFLVRVAEEANSISDSLDGSSPITVNVLSISKQELGRDLRSLDFDQCTLWRLVYEFEFGMAGGEPFGAPLGDYEFANRPDDIMCLKWVSRVAAASLAPFIGLCPRCWSFAI